MLRLVNYFCKDWFESTIRSKKIRILVFTKQNEKHNTLIVSLDITEVFNQPVIQKYSTLHLNLKMANL